MLNILSWLFPKRLPDIPEVFWTEEFWPNSGILEGDDARMIVMYRNGSPSRVYPYHRALVDSIINVGSIFVDLTNNQLTGPGNIPNTNVVLDLVSETLKKELRVWNTIKKKRKFGL